MTKKQNSDDIKFMARALELACKGQGQVSPNPLVGCVIVKKNKIIAEGWHKKFGGPHAEIDALRKLKFNAQGTTLYVTLEPCHHFGKTPPCVDAVIQAKVARVVVAMRDPNLLTNGKSLRKLKKAGIAVTVGVLRAEAEKLNRGFVKRITTGLPFVIAKMAVSRDGKIAAKLGQRTSITGKESQSTVHDLRSCCDAVVIGAGTARIDNPKLNVRLAKNKASQPKRVILSSDLNLPPKLNVLNSPGGEVWLLTALPNDHSRCVFWQKRGATVFAGLPAKKGIISIQTALLILAQQGVNCVLIEPGQKFATELLKQKKCVDEWQIFISPKYLGKNAVPALVDYRKKRLWQTHQMDFFGKDVRIIATAK